MIGLHQGLNRQAVANRRQQRSESFQAYTLLAFTRTHICRSRFSPYLGEMELVEGLIVGMKASEEFLVAQHVGQHLEEYPQRVAGLIDDAV